MYSSLKKVGATTVWAWDWFGVPLANWIEGYKFFEDLLDEKIIYFDGVAFDQIKVAFVHLFFIIR